jgi:short-subunit dehydrogenase
MRVVPLDVTQPASIAAALGAIGPIDALVNDAGIGLFGAFEATPMATTRELFETNTFGVMAMTQAVLAQFREGRKGVIVNVTRSRRHFRPGVTIAWRGQRGDLVDPGDEQIEE